MNFAARHWLSAVLLAVLALLPTVASAGLSSEELGKLAFNKSRKLADQGNADGQVNLADCYARGVGVAKDEVEAVKWLRKAAAQGYSRAQCQLGYCYARGQGVAKDEVEAVAWYRKAAAQGYAEAQIQLGYLYTRGQGVTKDEVEAYAYWSLVPARFQFIRDQLAALETNLAPDARLRGQQRTKELQKEIDANKVATEAVELKLASHSGVRLLKPKAGK
jgi:TPR repeat protein